MPMQESAGICKGNAMKGTVLFYLWEHHRKMLIERHRFYVNESMRRLLGQFENIARDAEIAAEEWLNERSPHFDPDRDDPSDLPEAAYHHGVAHYQLLCEIQESTRLSILAGMYHQWEELKAAICKSTFPQIVELFDALGWRIEDEPFYQHLDICRLVVNVFKHGDGKAFKELGDRSPNFLRNPTALRFPELLEGWRLHHNDLTVTDEHLREFSKAIIAFWRAVPERLWKSPEVVFPSWIEKALRSDRRSMK
jgi:hypothetical protein